MIAVPGHLAPEYALREPLRPLRNLDYLTADLRPDIQADIHELPFEDASFDLILCSHVLEHVDDDRQG